MRTALCALLLLASACATTKPAPDTAPPVTAPTAPETTTPEPTAASPEDRPTSRYDGKDMRCTQVQECTQKLGDPPSDAIWACDAGLCQARGNNPTH